MKTTAMKRVLALVLVLMTVLSSGIVTALADVESSGTILNLPLKITAEDLSYPSRISQGSSADVLGTVYCNYGKITKVEAKIFKGSKVYQSTTWKPLKKHFKLDDSVNKKLKFGKLAAGTYTLRVTVTAEYKDIKKVTKNVINKRITVTPRVPLISIYDDINPEGNLHVGEPFKVHGVITTDVGKIIYVYVAILDDNGKVVVRTDFKPNATSFKLTYTANQNLPFELLPKGDYHYRVYAKVKYNGKTYMEDLVYTDFSIVK